MTRESRLSLGKQESWHPFFVRPYKKLGVNFEINFFKLFLTNYFRQITYYLFPLRFQNLFQKLGTRQKIVFDLLTM